MIHMMLSARSRKYNEKVQGNSLLVFLVCLCSSLSLYDLSWISPFRNGGGRCSCH